MQQAGLIGRCDQPVPPRRHQAERHHARRAARNRRRDGEGHRRRRRGGVLLPARRPLEDRQRRLHLEDSPGPTSISRSSARRGSGCAGSTARTSTAAPKRWSLSTQRSSGQTLRCRRPRRRSGGTRKQPQQTILVVEDESSIASFVSLYLKNAYYSVRTAATDGGLSQAATGDVSLIILDLMPRHRRDRGLPAASARRPTS